MIPNSNSTVGKLNLTHDRRLKFVRVFTFLEDDRTPVDVSELVFELVIKTSEGDLVSTMAGGDITFLENHQISVEKAASHFTNLSRLEAYRWEFAETGSDVPLFEGIFKLV